MKLMKNILLVFFLIFGSITIKEGGTALIGTMTGTISGSYWLPVIALNTATGFLYVGMAVTLFFNSRLASLSAWAVIILATLSSVLFFGYAWVGGAYEQKTIYASLFRLIVAIGAVAGVRKFDPR
ncbi:MAG: hypothetical protein K8R21_02765 [Leptospira sp.]|nr:hypothetical protein [Leptospira sp.]